MLTEITADDLRALCNKVKARGAPATAVHVRDIVKQIYGFAILHGEKVANPADDVGPSSIATFVPKDRALSPTGNPVDAPATRIRGVLPHDPACVADDPPDAGAQERTDPGHLG
jgi:hypothetical protein